MLLFIPLGGGWGGGGVQVHNVTLRTSGGREGGVEVSEHRAGYRR
jgi:hypothetical protein